MNEYSVFAFFPEVKPAHAAEQSVTVNAEGFEEAMQQGFATIRERDELKYKRITTVKIVVSLIDCKAPPAPGPQTMQEAGKRFREGDRVITSSRSQAAPAKKRKAS